MKFWKKQHIDAEKLQQERVRKAEIAEILDHGTEEDFIQFLKTAGIPITEERLNEFRKRRSEKRGLLR